MLPRELRVVDLDINRDLLDEDAEVALQRKKLDEEIEALKEIQDEIHRIEIKLQS